VHVLVISYDPLSTAIAYSVWQGIKFKVIAPPSSLDVIDACAKDAVR